MSDKRVNHTSLTHWNFDVICSKNKVSIRKHGLEIFHVTHHSENFKAAILTSYLDIAPPLPTDHDIAECRELLIKLDGYEYPSLEDSLKVYREALGRELLFVTNPKWRNDPRQSKGVPLSPEVREMLREWMGESDSPRVFPSPQNQQKPMAQPTANKALTYACQRAEIEPLGFPRCAMLSASGWARAM